MSESAYKCFELNSSGYLSLLGVNSTSVDVANSPRQSYPDTFCANGYVDVLSVDHIRQTRTLHGDKVVPFVTDFTPELDTVQDFQLVEYYASSNPDLIQNLFAVS